MSFSSLRKPDPTGNYFTVPNVIFSLGLEYGEIAVYNYLLRCENRKTYQCWPSYNTIGAAVHMSKNTVKKYVAGLEGKRLITTEYTNVQTQDGSVLNGNLRYTILPIQEAVDCFHERQMAQLELEAERQRAMAKLAEYDRVAPQEPLCAALPEAAGTDPDRGLESGFGAVSEDFRGTKEKAG